MSNTDLARYWIIIAGIVLVVVGLLGFVENPIVYEENAAFTTGAVHNIVHLGSGLLALAIGFGLRGLDLANGVLGFGVLYLAVFVLVLASPDLFGLFEVSANAGLHVIHAALAVVSLAAGYLARNEMSERQSLSPSR